MFGDGIFFAEINKKGEGKGGEYLEKENILFAGEQKTEKEKEKIFWRRKMGRWRTHRQTSV